MNYRSNEDKAKSLGVVLSSLSSKELWCLRGAQWDDDIKRYLCPVTCSKCFSVFDELLTIALSAARGEVKPVCIRCDNAARVSSAVNNVIITG